MFRNGQIVLWKHYLIRKRHWILTLLEIILPVLVFLIVAYCRAKLSVIKKIEVPAEEHYPTSFTNIDTYLTKILYAPSNPSTDDIIHRVQEKLQFPTSNVFAFSNEDTLVDFYTQDNCERAIGIIFEQWKNLTFKYTLRVHEQNAIWNNDVLFSSEVFNDYRQVYYSSSGFLSIQQALDNVFIEKFANKTIPMDINLKSAPFPPRVIDVGVTTLYCSVLPLVTIFSFLLVFPLIVYRVVEEKKNGTKELQKMVGLKSRYIWFGWFVHGIVPALISVIIIVILMKVPFWGVEYPPIEYTNGFIFFIFLALYCSSNIFFCFVFSTLTNKPTFSMIFTFLFWIFSYFISDKVLLASGSPRFLKVLLGLFPNVLLDLGFKIMQNFEQKEIGVQWNNLFELSVGGQNELPMAVILLLFIVDIIIFSLLTVYIDNINPGTYGIRESLFFPFKKIKKVFSRTKAQVDEQNSCEEGRPLKPPGIKLINVSKRFGAYMPVDDLSLDIDQNQITVLLGHNGAGKTTVMHMMTGMIETTQGTIFIDDKNIRTEMDTIRESLGLCPQHNLVFQDLTVEEHLLFFGMLKGITKPEAREDAKVLMINLSLFEKRNHLARTLSGGMKRKLCLGMAMIGNPKVLILDEPTSGMDPESRRAVWDMLKKKRSHQTILITTHFLEEADFLGDKIAIMSHGNVIDHDTPLELKKKYNTGYNLSMSLNCDSENEKKEIKDKVLAIINKESVNASDVSAFGNTICVNLEIGDKSKFPTFLAQLESKKDELKIENMSLTLTKLEDVFLKSMDSDEIDRTEIVPKGGITSKEKVQIFKALLKKQWHCFNRRKWYFVFTAILVGILQLGNMALSQNFLFGLDMLHEPKINLTLSTYGSGSVFYQGVPGRQDVMDFYENIITSQKSLPKLENNVDEAIIQEGVTNLEYYKKHIFVGAIFSEETINAMYACSAYHGPPISVNLITNAIAKSVLGEKASISVSAWPLAPKKSTTEPKKISEDQITIIWSFLFPIGLILLLCPYIIHPNEELSSKFTTIQFMAGVSPWLYWCTIYIMDLAILLAQIIILLVIQSFQTSFDFNIFYTTESFGTFVLIVAILLIVTLPYVYLFGRLQKLSSGVALFIILNMVIGAIPYAVIYVLKEFGTSIWSKLAQDLDVLLMILSPSYGYTAIGNFYAKQTTRLYNWNEMIEAERMVECREDPNQPCCRNDKEACAAYTSYFGSEDNKLCLHLTFMILGAFIYLALNIFLDKCFKNARDWAYSLYDQHRYHHDNNLDNGNNIPLTDTQIGKGFMGTNIKKFYGGKKTVDIKKMLARKGKCLGLLGTNGAGKTTTFNIITKQLRNDNPDGKIQIVDSSDQKNDTVDTDYLMRLGYCPQEDVLNFTLTGEELLTVMAYIRGVTEVENTVQKFLKMFDLTEHKDKMIKTYSGGNKRKLCAAVSFLGINDVVLLDEPTSGVDAKSRRNFWKILKTYQFNNDLTTILTSHSMDECEALCDYLLIMKNGEIKKDAPISKLKREFSGYILSFKLKTFDITDANRSQAPVYERLESTSSNVSNKDEFKEEIKKRFQNCELKDDHYDSLQYQITTGDRLSKIFNEVENIIKDTDIVEDYSISEASIEEIFLHVAKNEAAVKI